MIWSKKTIAIGSLPCLVGYVYSPPTPRLIQMVNPTPKLVKEVAFIPTMVQDFAFIPILIQVITLIPKLIEETHTMPTLIHKVTSHAYVITSGNLFTKLVEEVTSKGVLRHLTFETKIKKPYRCVCLIFVFIMCVSSMIRKHSFLFFSFIKPY